jgi:hypothetical protein
MPAFKARRQIAMRLASVLERASCLATLIHSARSFFSASITSSISKLASLARRIRSARLAQTVLGSVGVTARRSCGADPHGVARAHLPSGQASRMGRERRNPSGYRLLVGPQAVPLGSDRKSRSLRVEFVQSRALIRASAQHGSRRAVTEAHANLLALPLRRSNAVLPVSVSRAMQPRSKVFGNNKVFA